MTEIRPAATVVLLRDTRAGLKTLLLRRHRQMKVGAGNWVFPGGTVDPEDFSNDRGDLYAAALRAAVRETFEEAAVTVSPDSLQFISHWTTPAAMGQKRFSTWFFLTEVDDKLVVVDGTEIDEHQWCLPQDALERHAARELELMPPTVVTLTELVRCANVAAARAFYREREVPMIEPRMSSVGEAICMLYPGDVGYEVTDATLPGARSRCWLEDGVWRYECSW